MQDKNEKLNWGQSKLNNNNMNEKQLVSFGNYLLNKCKVKGHDLDGEACFDRQVTDADLCNWIEANPGILNPQEITLPSKYQYGDHVRLDFFDAGFVKNGTVIKIHFTENKVLYDVDVTISTDVNGKPNKTRLYNIDSCFVVD